MARQIRVIKCPQCGGPNPTKIDKDRYRCDKCSTEFILDTDDINVNVNVNHRYEQSANNNGASFLKIFFVIIAILGIVGVIFVVSSIVKHITHSKQTVQVDYTRTNQKPKRSKDIYALPLGGNSPDIVFYVTREKGESSAKFCNIATNTILKEQKLPFDIDGEKLEHRFFLSDSTYYVIFNQKLIYKINLKDYTFSDITADICARKPALNAGIMSVAFVREGYGEGFSIDTNLGKKLYYFPESNMLYSQKACNYVLNNISSSLSEEAKDMVYYLFLNKESAHSSNVAQLYEITYKFNNGGPECKLMKMSKATIENPEHYAIKSYKPITKDCVYFSPQVLYSDKQNILISYQPSLAVDAGTHIDLLNVNGQTLWSKPFKDHIEAISTVRTNKGFVLQTSEKAFININLNGQQVESYTIQE